MPSPSVTRRNSSFLLPLLIAAAFAARFAHPLFQHIPARVNPRRGHWWENAQTFKSRPFRDKVHKTPTRAQLTTIKYKKRQRRLEKQRRQRRST